MSEYVVPDREWGEKPFQDVWALLPLTDGIGLPLPRLQLIYLPSEKEFRQDISGCKVTYCYYVIVFPCADYDSRCDDRMSDLCTFGLLSVTKVTFKCGQDLTGLVCDSLHARRDSKALGGLPVYVSCGRGCRKIDV